MGSGRLIKDAIKKYGRDNFKKEILEFFNTREELLLKEKEIVNQDFIERNDTYNLAIGGSGYTDINKLKTTIGKVTVRDLTGKTMSVSKDDPRYLSGELVGVTKNKILVKNQKVEHLFGKYETYMKHDQIFELAYAIERYLFRNNVFRTKEEYGSGEEWRGTFEFIGSKYIDKEQLDICINYLK